MVNVPQQQRSVNPSKPTPAWVWAGMALAVVFAGTYYVVANRRYT